MVICAKSIVHSLLEDADDSRVDTESPEEAHDRIKASIVVDANAYAKLSGTEKANYWLRYGKIPTPAEEPDATVRYWVASWIPVELITGLLTPEEEPDAMVRWRVAESIPAARITRLLTPVEEPSADVRRAVSDRML